MNIKVVRVSKDEKFKLEKDAFDAIDSSLAKIDAEYVPNNIDSLAKVYNKYLSEERNSSVHDYLIFLHADVSFNVEKFMKHLEEVGPKYDLLGLCGTSRLDVSRSPLNWYTGSNQTPLEKWGCVTHGEAGFTTTYFSEHSPNVLDAEVSCIDGLCIIFTKKAISSGLSFDENLGKFSFYDTDISLQAVMTYRLKLGVMVQLDLCHHSIGKSITQPEFLDDELKFRNKWNFPIPPNSAIERHLQMKNLIPMPNNAV